MTARTVLQLAAGAVSATATGISVNLATAAGASPWMWLAVVGATLAGIAIAVWAAMGNGGRPDSPDDRSARTGVAVRGRNVVVAETIVGSPVTQGRPGHSPAAVAALVLVAVGTGLAFGLAYGADRDSGSPNDIVPTTAVSTPAVSPTSTGVTTATVVDAPTRDPDSAVQPPPAPEPESIGPPPESAIGAWLSLDNTFETLYLYADGRYRWENPPQDDGTGRYQLEGSQLTFVSGAAAGEVFTWSVRDALLTLTDEGGSRRQYTRN